MFTLMSMVKAKLHGSWGQNKKTEILRDVRLCCKTKNKEGLYTNSKSRVHETVVIFFVD